MTRQLAQNVHKKGHPLDVITGVHFSFLCRKNPRIAVPAYFEKSNKCLAGKGMESKSCIRGLFPLLIIFPSLFLYTNPVISLQLSFLNKSGSTASPSLITYTSTPTSLIQLSGSLVACAPPATNNETPCCLPNSTRLLARGTQGVFTLRQSTSGLNSCIILSVL